MVILHGKKHTHVVVGVRVWLLTGFVGDVHHTNCKLQLGSFLMFLVNRLRCQPFTIKVDARCVRCIFIYHF